MLKMQVQVVGKETDDLESALERALYLLRASYKVADDATDGYLLRLRVTGAPAPTRACKVSEKKLGVVGKRK